MADGRVVERIIGARLNTASIFATDKGAVLSGAEIEHLVDELRSLDRIVLANLHWHVPACRDSFIRTKRERDQMARHLAELTGIRVFPSAANFMLIELPSSVNGALIRDRLLTVFGLFVRECSNKLGASSRDFRLAVRTRAGVDRSVYALREVLMRQEVVK